MAAGWQGSALKLVIAILLSQWHAAEATWSLGSQGASCDATCTALSLTCVAERMRLITSRDQIDYAVSDGSLPACSLYADVEGAHATVQPYQTTSYVSGVAGLPPLCFYKGTSSDCASSFEELERICCCYSGTGDVADQCPMPTTTTTTVTRTTSTDTTVTTTSIPKPLRPPRQSLLRRRGQSLSQ